MNKVIGFHGRAGATGFTELKSWDAFEGEMRKIWENCREFNQEGSEIYTLAGELEVCLTFLEHLYVADQSQGVLYRTTS